MSTAQKIATGFAIMAVVVYLAFTALKEGGFRALERDLTVAPTMSPAETAAVASVQASPILTVSITPTQTPVQTTAAPTSPTAVSAILNAINAQRAKVGVAALSADGVLQTMAQAHASDMVARGYFSHTSPAGVSFQQRIEASGYGGTATAENLGLTSGAAVEVVDGWMGSDGHRINMLNGQYGDVGIGVAVGPWQGFSAVFAVAVFGNAK